MPIACVYILADDQAIRHRCSPNSSNAVIEPPIVSTGIDLPPIDHGRIPPATTTTEAQTPPGPGAERGGHAVVARPKSWNITRSSSAMLGITREGVPSRGQE